MGYLKMLTGLVALALLGAALTGSLADWGFWIVGAIGASWGYVLRGGDYERRKHSGGPEHATNPANGLPMAGNGLDIYGNPYGVDRH